MLDEPTNGLDPAGTVEMRAMFSRLAEAGTSVIVSSHLLSEIQAACDRLIMIQQGRLVFSGPLDDLLAAQHAVVMAVTDDPADGPRLAELVKQAGKVAWVEDASVEVKAEPEWSGTLGRLAFDAGIVLRELRPVEANLETTFLEMTNNSNSGIGSAS